MKTVVGHFIIMEKRQQKTSVSALRDTDGVENFPGYAQ